MKLEGGRVSEDNLNSSWVKLKILKCKGLNCKLKLWFYHLFHLILIMCAEFDSNFKLLEKKELVIEDHLMIHDWAFTDTHYILFANRIKLDVIGM